jgi:16S rRNA (guanine527-N7)-methyltransferase
MTPREVAEIEESAAELGIVVGETAIRRLGLFVGLLAEWNARFALVSGRAAGQLVRGHVVDSLAVVPHLPDRGLVIDIGSGGGFPGIVLASVRSDLDFALIDSRRRPTTFLREAVRRLEIPRARVLTTRAEEAARDPSLAARAATVVSRGVRLDRFLPVAVPFLAGGGRVIAMQTPRSDGSAAIPPGLVAAGGHDYRLRGGEWRRLLFFEAG